MYSAKIFLQFLPVEGWTLSRIWCDVGIEEILLSADGAKGAGLRSTAAVARAELISGRRFHNNFLTGQIVWRAGSKSIAAGIGLRDGSSIFSRIAFT
jgi:hypothetical protein